MAFEAGKGAVFLLDDSGSTQRNISAYISNIDFPREVGTAETTVLGDNDRTYIVTLNSASFSMSGHWDGGVAPAIDVVLSGILGLAAARDFEYGPQGNASGDIKYSGTCFLTRYTITTNVDGSVDWSADFQVTGAVTRGTF